MIHMGLSDEERKEKQDTFMGESPKYYHGLNLHLEDEAIKKLGITEAPKLGEKFMLVATVEVSSVNSDRESKDDSKEFNMGLQITDMELKKGEEKEKSAVSALYGDE